MDEGDTGEIRIVSNIPVSPSAIIEVQLNVPGFYKALATGNCGFELARENALVMSSTACSVPFNVSAWYMYINNYVLVNIHLLVNVY